MKEIKKLIEKLHSLTMDEIAKRDEYYNDRSEKWQEEKGDEYLEETSLLEDLVIMLEDYL